MVQAVFGLEMEPFREMIRLRNSTLSGLKRPVEQIWVDGFVVVQKAVFLSGFY